MFRQMGSAGAPLFAGLAIVRVSKKNLFPWHYPIKDFNYKVYALHKRLSGEEVYLWVAN